MIDLPVARSLRKDPFATNSIPKETGVYVMYDHGHVLALGKDVSPNIDLEKIDYTKNVAYVGSSGNLRNRIRQHMIDRNSSVVTGVSAAVLNPDKISHICWWCHEDFSDKNRLKAAEMIAFQVFNPSLRSLAPVAKKARGMLENPTFYERMGQLLNGTPTGLYYPMTFKNLTYWSQEIERRST